MSNLLIAAFAVGGVLYGVIVSLLNQQVLVRGWESITPENLQSVDPETLHGINKLKRRVMIRYGLHFAIDLFALFLVAWLVPSIPALLGAAAGMVISQKFLIVKYIKTGKEVKE
ncbi:MAG: hypothetical protein RSB05_08360 [Clostridiales bacterium]